MYELKSTKYIVLINWRYSDVSEVDVSLWSLEKVCSCKWILVGIILWSVSVSAHL